MISPSSCFKCGEDAILYETKNDNFSIYCESCEFIGYFNKETKKAESAFLQISEVCYIVFDFTKNEITYHIIPRYSGTKTTIIVDINQMNELNYQAVIEKYQVMLLML